MEENVLQISERYLNELIKFHSNSLVGKACKRFEISNNLKAIKLNVKELIYEEFRSFISNIESYNEGGREITIFKFKGRE